MVPLRAALWFSIAVHAGLFAAVAHGTAASARPARLAPPLASILTEPVAPPPAPEVPVELPVCSEEVATAATLPELEGSPVEAAVPAPLPADLADEVPARCELTAAFASERWAAPTPPPPSPPPPLAAAATASPPVDRVLEVEPGDCPPPRYPPAARRRGLEGTVLLRVVCDAHGSVVAVEIVRSSGHDLLDEAARAAVRQWRFRNGPGHLEQPIEFRLGRALGAG